MTATELFRSSHDALAITGPAEWDSADFPGQRDALVYIDDESAEDGPIWCLAPIGSEDADYWVKKHRSHSLTNHHLDCSTTASKVA